VLALYKGVTSPIAGVAFINGIVFGTYGPTLRFLQDRYQRKTGQLPSHSLEYTHVFVSGAVAGFVQSFVCSPVELAKTILQVQKENVGSMSQAQQKHVGTALYTGPVDVLQKLIKQNGIRGFYRGFIPTVLRDVPSFALYFSSYIFISNCLMREDQTEANLDAWQVVLSGGMAGCLSWIVNVPIDVVKSRIQGDSITKPVYRGFRDCALKVYRNEGVKAFFQGMVPIILRAFPTNGTTFFVYSLGLQYMTNLVNKGER
jgi:hypothetical protein